MTTPLLDSVINLIFPQRCAFCNRVSGSKLRYCKECDSRLRLALPQSMIMLGETPCYSVFRYSGGVRHAIGDLKFRGRRELADFFAAEMSQLLDQVGVSGEFDTVAYLPMPPERERDRGYNQAKLLADGIAKLRSLPCSDCGLYRTATFAQHDLHLSMRSKQQGAGFAMTEGVTVPPRVLLVDDLCTSGNSLRSCIRLLQGAGAREIVAVTVARGEK